MKVYKIRDKETGLYLCKGSDTYCNERGKSYTSIKAARGRVAWAIKEYEFWNRRGQGRRYSWEIVELEVTETELRTIPVAELVKEDANGSS